MKFLGTLAFFSLLGCVPCVSAQQISGCFYPEKKHYLVGVPIVVVFEVLNGSPKTIKFDNFNCSWLHPDRFEVDNATPRKTIELYGCGRKTIAGSCLGSTQEIRPGKKYRERFLLDGPFELDSPGTYHVRAKSGLEGNLNVTSEFSVDIRAPKPGELEAAYKTLFHKLHSKDIMIQQFAALEVVQNPPSFAEGPILALADDRDMSELSIEGLKRLATPATRAKLVEMASASSPEYVRQPAIQALGEIGTPEDCQAMLAIARASTNYTQAEAYIMAGHICGERALPALKKLAGPNDSQLLMGVAYGLANTCSREAVAPLIGLLQNSDVNVRRTVSDALATITHRASPHGIEVAASAEQSYVDWLNWWSVNSGTAPIYGSDQCGALQPLP